MELHGDDDETYGDDFDRAEEVDIASIVARQGHSDSDAEMARLIEEDEREREREFVVQGSSKDLVASTATEVGKSGASCPVCSTLLPMDKNEAATHVNRCLDGGASLTNFLPPRSSLFSKSLSKSASAKANPFFAKPSASAKPTIPAAPNAFSALMSKNQDSKAWESSEAADKKKGRLPKGEIRVVPFYKWVGGAGTGIGMQITVDAFKYGKIEGCKAYFLSHAHSDHYQNLSASWLGGPVYCSTVTAKLIKLKLNVKDKYLIPLEMNKTHLIEGVNVTLIDANHCPGSTIFLFEGPQSDPKSPLPPSSRIYRYLHCGDFRASPAHLAHPVLRGKKLDICYLDTTYLDPKYCFPAQELVINACVDLVRAKVVDGDDEGITAIGGAGMEGERGQMKGWLTKGKKEEVEEAGIDAAGMKGKAKEVQKADRWLVVVGTYSVGKERIVKNIAVSLKTKIYANPTKMKLLRAQDDPLLNSLLTPDPLLAQVHVVFLSSITNEHLAPYLAQYRHLPNGFTKLIGLRPTGWTYRPEKDASGSTIASVLSRESLRIQNPAGMIPQRDSKPGCLAFGVPYSEHSSFFELTCFALTLDCVKFIPTVNVGKKAFRDKMTAWFDRWSVEKRRRKLAGIPPPHPRSESYW